MIQFQNWYETYLTSPIVTGTLVIPVNVPPTVTEGLLVLDYDQPSLREIIHFTSHDAVSVTVPASGDTGTGGTGRGYESTTARNHAQNAKIRMQFTAGTASSIQTAAAVIANQNNNGGWIARAETPVYATNNGNKEFTFTVPADLTGVISQGMKIKMDRVVTPPTQAMSFASASSQYATKAAPSGITFTGAHTTEAWIYVNSYTGTPMGIIGRSDDTTTGFQLELDGTGRLRAYYAAASNFSDFVTWDSVPLKRWYHVAASVSNVATRTVALYMNGILKAQTGSLSAATTLVQGSNLTVGGIGAGVANRFFNGYIAEARVWSVAQTQSAIQNNMGINLVGSETNLVALFKGNGVFTDATVNANSLTATNGAAFTTMATTPGVQYFNPTEYFLVTGKPVYGAPNTTITAFGGTDFNLPNAALTNFYFSMQRAPFGFPADRGKWGVMVFINSQYSVANTAGVWYNIGSAQLQVPTGAWDLAYISSYLGTTSVAAQINVQLGLSTVNNAVDDIEFLREVFNRTGDTGNGSPVEAHRPRTMTAMTTYYLNAMNGANGGNLYNGDFASSTTPAFIEAVSNYV